MNTQRSSARLLQLAAWAVSLCFVRLAVAQCDTQQLVSPDVPDQEHFGSPALDDELGTATLISAEPDGVSYLHLLYSLVRQRKGWVIEDTIDNPAGIGTPNDSFGQAAVIEDDLLLVGAPASGVLPGNWGIAYIFNRQGDKWQLVTHLEPSDYDPAQLFGWSIDIDGDVIVVGARDDDIEEFSQAGSAYVFRYDPETDQWLEEQKLTAFEPITYQLFGQSVAVDGDVIIVGAHSNGNELGLPGAAYVFRFNGVSWIEEAKLTPFDGSNDMRFGWSVDVSGDVIAVTAIQADNKGAVYVFRHVDSAWQFEQKLVPRALVGCCPWFGGGVELYSDASRFVSNAGFDDAAAVDAGSAHVARYAPEEGWVFLPPIYSATPEANGMFGIRDVDGDTALASGQDGPGTHGQIHVIEGMLGIDCNSNGQADACDIFYGVSGDANADRVPDECENPADLNGDNMVGPADLAELLAQWGQCPPPREMECSADIAPAEGDNVVGVLDLAQLLAAWD